MAVSVLTYGASSGGYYTTVTNTSMLVVLSRTPYTPLFNSVYLSTAYAYSGPNIGIYYMDAPPIGNYTADYGSIWMCLSGTNTSGLLDTDYGSAVDSVLSKTLTSKAGGMCISVAKGTEETSLLELTIDGSTATYVVAAQYGGYRAATATTCVCTANDPSFGSPTIYGVFVSIDPKTSVGGSQAIWWG